VSQSRPAVIRAAPDYARGFPADNGEGS